METRRPGWRPPHCPNPNCKYHKSLTPNWRYKRKGFFCRRIRPHRIQRFTCLHCNRQFSSQTFSTTYWQKRPELTAQVLPLVVGCMGNRQIARALKISPSTVQHHISHLARHFILFHTVQMRSDTCSAEIVIDGLETFELSQYFPFHHNVAVEPYTGFFLHHTDSPMRRKGRMTPQQRCRRDDLERRYGRPDPQAVRKGMAELLEIVTAGRREVLVRSDDHTAYPSALRGLTCRVTHHTTSSRQPRDRYNPLFEVNLLDRFLRHSTAAHKRETIAWAKRRQASAEKLSIFLVWRNYMKRRRENGPSVSPAMLKGLTQRILNIPDVLAKRLFRTRTSVSPRWALYYDRRVETPALGVNRAHTLTYAY